MDVQQPQHAGFVAAHLAAKADDVGEHDRGQSPIFSMHSAAGVVIHRYGLFGWRCLTVNQPPPCAALKLKVRICQ